MPFYGLCMDAVKPLANVGPQLSENTDCFIDATLR